MASDVTVAATVPSKVSAQVAASPGGGGGWGPEAMQNTTSPSTGVYAGIPCARDPGTGHARNDRATALVE